MWAKQRFYLERLIYAGLRTIPLIDKHEQHRFESRIQVLSEQIEQIISKHSNDERFEAYKDRLLTVFNWELQHLKEGAPLRNWKEEYKNRTLINRTAKAIERAERSANK